MKSILQRRCCLMACRGRFWISLIVWLSGWWVTTASWGLEITQQKWGFDGQVRSEQFNLLSVQVSNPGTIPFDGEIRLERIQGFDVVDAPIVETLYLTPGTSRWIQFYPWIDEVGFSTWRLVWGKGAKERGALSSPRGTRDRPALVVLEQSGQIARPNVGTGGFAEELFPRSVTGCAGLGGMILDHEPRWSEAQQQAFVDWIRLGVNCTSSKGPRVAFQFLPDCSQFSTDEASAKLWGLAGSSSMICRSRLSIGRPFATGF